MGREMGDGNCVLWGTGEGFNWENGCISLGAELFFVSVC